MTLFSISGIRKSEEQRRPERGAVLSRPCNKHLPKQELPSRTQCFVQSRVKVKPTGSYTEISKKLAKIAISQNCLPEKEYELQYEYAHYNIE